MIPELEYVILLLPGFFVYITVIRFLNSDEKRNSLETVFFSFMLSIVISTGLTVLAKYGRLTINLFDWRFGSWITVMCIILIIVLLIFFKKIFPWMEKKTQIFDMVKSTSKNVLFDIFEDELNKSKKPIWLHIITKDGLSFTGNLVMHGLTKDKSEAIYIKQPKITTKKAPYNIDPVKGLLIPIKNVKYVGLIDNEYNQDKSNQ